MTAELYPCICCEQPTTDYDDETGRSECDECKADTREWRLQQLHEKATALGLSTELPVHKLAEYVEHGLRPGRQVTRLRMLLIDGTELDRLYLYDTGASVVSGDSFGVGEGTSVEPWDGREEVSCYAGD